MSIPTQGVSVVTTTWNEKDNIVKLIPRLRQVLQHLSHEIIVIDDGSQDGTSQVARQYADKVKEKKREGQTKGLLDGMRLAKYPFIITIDADLENPPEYIPTLLHEMPTFDILVASRRRLPRLAEKIASRSLGKSLGVTDVFSNFRVFKREVISNFALRGGETFGAEFLIIAHKKGLRLGERFYDPPKRRSDPRVGGALKANMRCMWALIKSFLLYLF